MRCNLHQCLKPTKSLRLVGEGPCDDQHNEQLQLGLIKLCQREESGGCPFFGENHLGKMEPEDFLLP